jgi:hypothetical protein
VALMMIVAGESEVIATACHVIYHNLFKIHSYAIVLRRAISQAVSCRPVPSEAWIRARVSPSGICGGLSGTGTCSYPRSWVFPCQDHSATALHTHVSTGGLTIGPLVAAVQRHGLTPST